ncbi:HCL666Cp [Eremothecium sinecaudum]|uniref:Spindle pole body component KRE28 n=1 Tax=Eremothecium sinecaudum TaxID=45286 RepID=A0A120K1K4_9SACH|nr:HCL666Cp [Eremothecium sinecaudum]AMD19485.1 HCL666Cp [Eremothecium sinecaudum]
MDYSRTLQGLEDQTAHISEQVLVQQEQQRSGALNELQQTILQITENNKFLKCSANTDGKLLDPRTVPVQLSGCTKLAELLKAVHLEQETLDNFFRYTISNNDTQLEIRSKEDPRYVELSEELEQLESVELSGLEADIEKLDSKIIEETNKVTETNEAVNESCLSVGNVIDNCWKLLDELENLKRVHTKKVDELVPLEETHRKWKAMELDFQQQKHLKEQLSILEATKFSLEKAVDNSNSDTSANGKSSESFVTYQLLNDLWKKQFINDSEIKNLDFFPKTEKLQFQIKGMTCVVSLNSGRIIAIQLFSEETPIDQLTAAETELNSQYISTDEIPRLVQHIKTKFKEPQGVTAPLP